MLYQIGLILIFVVAAIIISKKFILVILISIPSAIIADYFNIPLAWMLGPMIITSIGALACLLYTSPSPRD